MTSLKSLPRLGALPIFFCIKLVSGLILLKSSSVSLSVDNFSVFSQLLLFGALLNMVSVGGVQNGLIRQVAASDIAEDRAQSLLAALFIWCGAFVCVGVTIFTLRDSVSMLLVGSVSATSAVVWITFAVFIAGPAQIFCAQLTGSGRAPISLAAQGTSLIVSTAACLCFLYKGHPTAAACAFYWGSTVNVAISWIILRKNLQLPRLDITTILVKTVELLRYSLAFLALVLIAGLTLFGLRYAYQEAFGLSALSFWLVAQRVSDTSTQLLGLYMIQFFVPQLVGSKSGAEEQGVIMRGWAIATGTMAFFLICFAIMPEFIVRTFLSEKFLPAVSLILLYMIGDVLRASVSLAMHLSFAKQRLKQYVAIEAFSMIIFSAITLGFIYSRNANAPFFGYIAAFGCMSALLLVLHLTKIYRSRHVGM